MAKPKHKKPANKKHEILSLSGSALLDYYRIQSDSSQNPLEIDLSKLHSYVYNDIVIGCNARNENAFFYQARAVIEKLYEESESNEKKNDLQTETSAANKDGEDNRKFDVGGKRELDRADKQKLICHMVYVDFNNVYAFSGSKKKTKKKQADDPEGTDDSTAASIAAETDGIEETDKRKEDDLKYAERLFTNGLNIYFTREDCLSGTPTHLVPYDKSNSMARNSTILFIDKDIKEELDKRLTIGIDFSKFQVVLSKYYAYRGLYLSDSSRIESVDFPLNKETVIVIPDDNKPFPYSNSKKAETDEPDTVNVVTGDDKKKSNLYDIYEAKQQIRMNAFDGEGLICPEYAAHIRKALNNDASSFQVRMPFTKGMLHELDWQGIINEAMSPDGAPVFGELPIWIKDCFGIERDLTKAKIILTKSMFKCAGWYDDWKKTMGEAEDSFDPMQHYFDNFDEYHHALYIANTDALLYNEGYTTLNYQFLNPLALSSDQIIELVDKHCAYIQDDRHIFAQYNDMSGEELLDSNLEPWKIVFREYPELLRYDKKINNKLRSRDESLRRMITKGNLYVKGECRFLARDLLALVLYILKCCPQEDWDAKKLKALQNQTLMSNHFFAAKDDGGDDSISYEFSKYYAVLRSPHLARNEETVMQPQAKRYYTKYMSHLTGVCMVNYNSLVPMALSGADFDGDLVKIFEEEIIVSAIQKNAYAPGKEQSYRKKDSKSGEGKKDVFRIYNRTLPEINIPSKSGKSQTVKETVDFETIKNTFSSRVGQISNMAVRIGMQHYKPNQAPIEEPQQDAPKQEHEEYEDRCAHCTILVGLEIDACKHGMHPDLSRINEYYKKLKKETGAKSEDYITKIKSIGGLPLFEGFKIDEKDANSFIIKKTKSREEIEVSRTPDTALDLLLTQFVERNLEARKCYGKPFRNLLKEAYGKEGYCIVDEAKKAEIRAIIEAYRDVLNRAKEDKKLESGLKNAGFRSRAITLLRLQYDSLYEEMEAFSGKYIIDVFASTVDRLNKIFEKRNAEECAACLKKIIHSNWVFTSVENRERELKELLGLGTQAAYQNEGNEMTTDKENELSQDEIKLLTNFDQSGYMILYYLIKEIAWEKEINDSKGASESEGEIDEGSDSEPENEGSDGQQGDADSKDSASDEQNAPYEYGTDYLKIYLNARQKKTEQTDWEEELNKACRADLERVINDKSKLVDHVLAIVIKADPNEDLFWSVFSAKEIIDYIRAAETSIEKKS